MNALMHAARAALVSCGLWRQDAVLLCALSGGCDSVALLHTLKRLQQDMPFKLHAIHVQHGLRGEDSLADEQFVRDLCRSLDILLTVENAGLTGNMHTPGMETLARERRRAIFERQMQLLHADALLTAHHQDDQVETVLMHLLRGSGMNGLCGMQTAAPFGCGMIVRPFLTVPKQQLRDALAAENLPCREDGSNQEAVTPRNALRLNMLPQLEALFPAACAHIAQLSESMQADEACLSAEAERLYQAIRYPVPPLFMLDAAPLASAPEAIRRRVLRRWVRDGVTAAGLAPQEQSLSHADTLALSALVSQPAGSRLNLPDGLMAAREKDWLHLLYQSGEPLCAAPTVHEIICPERTSYVLAHITLNASPAQALPRDASSVILSPEWLSRQPVLRTPQPEDTIRPFGAPGHKPLRRWMTDRRIDPLLRAALPVLCVQHEVLWIPGLCASELLRLDTVPQNALELKRTGETPFIPKPPKE